MFLDKKLWPTQFLSAYSIFQARALRLCARGAGPQGLPKIQRFDDWWCMVVKVTSEKTDLQEIKFFRLVGFHEMFKSSLGDRSLVFSIAAI